MRFFIYLDISLLYNAISSLSKKLYILLPSFFSFNINFNLKKAQNSLQPLKRQLFNNYIISKKEKKKKKEN